MRRARGRARAGGRAAASCPAARRSRTRPGPSTRSTRRSSSTAIDRHSYVVAIGGGAVLDAVGYAAATAHRGVRLVRVPTTTLSQDDSAVGVKNGINAFGKKNFVGTFAPPHAVLNDFDLLTTLDDRDWRAGISEAVKVALLKDSAFFAWIEQHARELDERSLDAMAMLVHRCAATAPAPHRHQRRSVRARLDAPARLRALGGAQARAAHAPRAAPRRGRRHRDRARLHLQRPRRQPAGGGLAPDRRAVRGRRAADLAPGADHARKRRTPGGARGARGVPRAPRRPAHDHAARAASARASRSTSWTRRRCWRRPTCCAAGSKKEEIDHGDRPPGISPLTQRELIDEYFMEHRVKVLDLAAFLDRLDRARERRRATTTSACARSATRWPSSPMATAPRVQRVQMIFSDPRRSCWRSWTRRAPRAPTTRRPDHGIHRPPRPHGLAHDRRLPLDGDERLRRRHRARVLGRL